MYIWQVIQLLLCPSAGGAPVGNMRFLLNANLSNLSLYRCQEMHAVKRTRPESIRREILRSRSSGRRRLSVCGGSYAVLTRTTVRRTLTGTVRCTSPIGRRDGVPPTRPRVRIRFSVAASTDLLVFWSVRARRAAECNPGQVVYTHMFLCHRAVYNLVPSNGR